MKKIILSFILVAVSQTAFAACTAVRGVMDIGSGNTKASVALVNCDTQTLVEDLTLEKNSESVAYADRVTKDNEIPDTILNTGAAAIHKLKSNADHDTKILDALKKINQSKIIWRGIATSVFRTTKNGAEAIKTLQNSANFPIQKISQDDEALFGFIAGQTAARDPKKAIVWDIGTGSQQIIYDKGGQLKKILLEERGSKFIKNRVINDIKVGGPKTPNPIGGQMLGSSMVSISKFIDTAEVTKGYEKLGEMPKGYEVIGIGGVHQGTIPAAMKGIVDLKKDQVTYNAQQVLDAIRQNIEKTDEQIGKYADSFVTNLILVYITMTEKMKVANVKICKYGTAMGYMLYQPAWSIDGSARRP